MESEGRKELVDMGKSSHMCSVPTVSLRLAVLNVFQGFFGPKMAVFGPKLQILKLRSATCESRSRPPPFLSSAVPELWFCSSGGVCVRMRVCSEPLYL